MDPLSTACPDFGGSGEDMPGFCGRKGIHVSHTAADSTLTALRSTRRASGLYAQRFLIQKVGMGLENLPDSDAQMLSMKLVGTTLEDTHTPTRTIPAFSALTALSDPRHLHGLSGARRGRGLPQRRVFSMAEEPCLAGFPVPRSC